MASLPTEIGATERSHAISTTLNELVNLVTYRHPQGLLKETNTDFKQFTLTEEVVSRIRFIKNEVKATPEEVTQIIFNHPPSVFVDVGEVNKVVREEIKHENPIRVTYSTTDEVGLSEEPINFDDNLNEQVKEKLGAFVGYCQTYLNTPIISDDFGTDHDRRRAWERGIKNTLNIVGQEGEEDFQKKWDMNRYTKNRRTTLVSGITLASSVFKETIGQGVLDGMREFIESVKRDINKAQGVFMEEDINKGVELFNNSCVNVVEFFTKNKEMTMPKHHFKFLSKLYSSMTERGLEGLPSRSDFFSHPQDYLGPNFQAILSFLDILTEYTTQELSYILEKKLYPHNLDGNLIENNNVVAQAVRQAMFSNLTEALTHPFVPKGSKVTVPVNIDAKHLKKVADVMGITGMEIFKGKEGEERPNSLLSQIFFYHDGSPLKFTDLKKPVKT
jgi:hypothetical protein